MEEIFFGCIPSILDGTENELNNGDFGSLSIPSSYSYQKYMPDALNQGNESTCVPHSFSAVYDYYNGIKKPETQEDNKFKHVDLAIHQIYNAKTNKGPGMSFKNALTFCKNNGVVLKDEYIKGNLENPFKIIDFAKIPNLDLLKKSLIINGPCLIAMIVRDMKRKDYWNGNANYGGHATSVIGYDDSKGLLVRNSWGKQWGDNGYAWLPYKDYTKILEAWSIIA